MFCQLIVILLAIVLTHEVCPGPDPTGLIRADSLILRNQQSSSRKHCYSVPLGQSTAYSSFSVAVSTSSISYQNFGIHSLDYSLQSQSSVPTQLSIILLISDSSNWIQITANYFATTRPDFWLGSFVVDTFIFLNCQSRNSNQNVITVANYIPTFTAPKSSSRIQSLAFISGIRTQTNFFVQEVQSSLFNLSTRTLSVNIKYSGDFQFLRLDYIVYDAQSTDFSIQIVQIVQTRSAQPTSYVFVGITKFEQSFGFSLGSKNQYSGFILRLQGQLECIGIICQQRPTCETQASCRANGGNVWTSKCIYCSQIQYYLNGQCINFCSGNFVYNVSQKRCVCINGYYQSADNCIPIPICLSNKVLINNVCQCQFGFSENNQGFCIPTPQCRNNQIVRNNQCVCIQGYGRNDINGVCSQIPKCDIQRNWNLDRRTLTCICKLGYINIGGSCVIIPNCSVNQTLVNNRCQCLQGYIQINGQCQIKTICNGINQFWNSSNNRCQCFDGYQRILNFKQQFCQRKIFCGQNYLLVNNRCVCRQNFVEIGGQICVPRCGVNEQFAQGRCKCISNHFKDANNICKPCGQNQHISQNKCICANNYYRRNDQEDCKLIPSCPTRSSWIQDRLACECDNSSEYLIDGRCQPCPTNQGWNGTRCVCRTGAYRIQLLNNQCYFCNLNTFYNGKDCQCKPGFYGNRFSCQKCHSSCSNCTGPNQNQCTVCVDVSYTLQTNGICTRKTPCPNGLYLDGSICRVCPTYCSSCSSSNICQQCIDGFRLISSSIKSNCSQICGDGKRFEQQCDDNNNVNGDGCSSTCTVEQGWTCTGGSSVTKSFCSQINYVRTIINPKSAVLLLGRVVQGIRLSHIPSTLTINNCQNCSKLLWIKVIKSDIVPSVSAQYISKSQYQFLVQLNFFGTLSIPVFTFTVQLNPLFSAYFSQQDMDQVEVIKVDPALLARFDEPDILTLQDVANQKQTIKVPNDAKNLVLGN